MTNLKDLSIHKIKEESQKLGLQAVILPDGDFFLNEYTAEEDNIRKHLTKFKGSVGQAFICNGELHLIVDGRYRIAAKQQFEGDQLHIVDYTPQIQPRMIEILQKANVHKVGVWSERTCASAETLYAEHFETSDVSHFFKSSFLNSEPDKLYQTDAISIQLAKNEIFFTHQVDTIARVTGLRSDVFPYMSSLPGLLFVTTDSVHLLTTFPIQDKFKGITIHKVDHLLDLSCLEGIFGPELENFVFDPNVTNQSTVNAVIDFCQRVKQYKVTPKANINSDYMSYKDNEEQDRFKDSFHKSSQAIWKTLEWARKNSEISEIDLKKKIIEEFRASGAWRESFHPICGFGANSAIIHYGQPSDKKKWDENEFLLLDCGAYYGPGVATDTTRTLFNGTPNEKAILMYSLVLRGLIKAQMSVFDPGTLGSQIDMLAREPLLQFGKNYAHGTGHGIGVHVHEAGYLLNPLSTVPLKEGQIGSIEPGYYEEGWGGIRLENAAIVVKHPSYEGKLTFEPLTYLPFEEELIDRGLFTDKELEHLDQYQEKSRSTLA